MTTEDLGMSDQGGSIPVVAVVIPSFDSARHIKQCLQALRAQITDLCFEVILVDSSSDGTDQIVADAFPEVRLVRFRDRLSVGAARNIGVEKARGKLVLFLDVDCIAEPTWIDQMSTPIHGADADGGRRIREEWDAVEHQRLNRLPPRILPLPYHAPSSL